MNDLYLDQISWGDWFYVDVTDFLPKDVDFPSLIPTYQFASLQDIRSSINPAFDIFWDNFTEIMMEAQRSSRQFSRQMKLRISQNIPDLKLPEDYNPPKYIGATPNITTPEADEEQHIVDSEVSNITFFTHNISILYNVILSLTHSWQYCDIFKWYMKM